MPGRPGGLAGDCTPVIGGRFGRLAGGVCADSGFVPGAGAVFIFESAVGEIGVGGLFFANEFAPEHPTDPNAATNRPADMVRIRALRSRRADGRFLHPPGNRRSRLGRHTGPARPRSRPIRPAPPTAVPRIRYPHLIEERLSMSETLAQRFARYAVGLSFEQIPEKTVHEAKRRIIDSLATAVGAIDSEAFAIARRCAGRVCSMPGARMLTGGESSVEWATFVNGLAIRYLDFNDTYLSLEPAHPSDNLSAVLAVGEAVGATGREMLAAAVLAYEIQCRLCDAASLRKHGIDHVTYGSLSSCLAACKLHKLDAVRTAHAVGLAGVCNIAIRQTRAGEMSMWKGCAFANAARNGVFAATLAAEGMTGPAPIFEGELGLEQVIIRTKVDVAPMGAEAGNADGFMIDKTYIKFWPVEYHAQSAVDAILQLRPEIGDWRAVERIDIHTFDAAVDIIGKDPEKYRPKTRETADHSMPYCVAVALVDGDVGLRSFDEHRLADEELIKLTNRVKLHRDADCNRRYPKGIPNRLTVTRQDGRTFVKEVEFPRGHAGNPMTDAELETKFRKVVEPVYGKAVADRVLAACWKFEDVKSSADVIRMFDK
jgi:2-methylcitrate dehydratase